MKRGERKKKEGTGWQRDEGTKREGWTAQPGAHRMAGTGGPTGWAAPGSALHFWAHYFTPYTACQPPTRKIITAPPLVEGKKPHWRAGRFLKRNKPPPAGSQACPGLSVETCAGLRPQEGTIDKALWTKPGIGLPGSFIRSFCPCFILSLMK